MAASLMKTQRLLSILGCATAEELHALNLMQDVFRFAEQHAALMAKGREHGQVHGAERGGRRRDGGIVAVRLHVRLLPSPVILAPSKSSPKTSPSCVPWSASCGRRKNLKPSGSLREVLRTISTMWWVRFLGGRNSAWSRTARPPMFPSGLRESASKRSEPPRLRGSCWRSQGVRRCNRRLWTSTPSPADWLASWIK